jgi:transcriptional regulator with XRE-family HTH domain
LDEARRILGASIRRARLRLGWSQRRLEWASGVDQTVISRLENGRLDYLRLPRLAAVLAALDGWVVGGLEPEPPPALRRLPAPGFVDEYGTSHVAPTPPRKRRKRYDADHPRPPRREYLSVYLPRRIARPDR